MKRTTVASLFAVFALPGVLTAWGELGAVPTGFGVSGTNSSTPSFFWTALASGAELYDLKVERLSDGAWRTFSTTSIAGDRTGHTLKDPGADFRGGLYRAALRAKATFWTGPWTTWTEFTISTRPVTTSAVPVSITATEDMFPRFPATSPNPPGDSPGKLRVARYNPSENPWTKSLKRTLNNGYAVSAQVASRTFELRTGVYRWDMGARKTRTENGTIRKDCAPPCLDATRPSERSPSDAPPR